jgi:hypothetical protein
MRFQIVPFVADVGGTARPETIAEENYATTTLVIAGEIRDVTEGFKGKAEWRYNASTPEESVAEDLGTFVTPTFVPAEAP